MSYRGSLKQCLNMMHYQFKAGNYSRLAIVAVPGGKYYTLHTDDELLATDNQPRHREQTLVCRLTPRELKAFTLSEQLALNWTPPDVHQ